MIGDSRVASQFDPALQGSRTPYSSLMKSFEPGTLEMKHLPMAAKKRFGVMAQDAMAKHLKNKKIQEREKKKLDASLSETLQALIESEQKGSAKEACDPACERDYINKKNYSNFQNNYSYRVQMQRQINKAKKHQPNASLSKLIDLGEF